MAKSEIEIKSPYRAPFSLISGVLNTLSEEFAVVENRRGTQKIYHLVFPDRPTTETDYELTELRNDDGEKPIPSVGEADELIVRIQGGTTHKDARAVLTTLAARYEVAFDKETSDATYYTVRLLPELSIEQ